MSTRPGGFALDDGSIDDPWIHGHRRGMADADPALQVRRLDADTFVLRQSKARTFEAPFLHLLLGRDRALLLDTGAVKDEADCPVRAAVEALVTGWLDGRPRDGYELVVAHTHAHGDHKAGDGQFADRPGTRVVGTDLESVRAEFGLEDWPAQVAAYDLGGRVLEVTGIPGHHATSIAILDPRTRTLFTGDTVYPGRLYVEDMPAFVDSLERLVDLARTRGTERVLGCHIERSSTGVDFPLGSRYQPDEARLSLTVADLEAVRDVARSVADRPGVHPAGPALIWNGPCRSAVVAHLGRLLVARVRGRG